jgi:transglutaminase-like putative cysteine protease
MRIKLRHEIVRSYEPAAQSVIQLLRVTPRNHEGQHVFGWRIDLDRSARLAQSEDAFGNVTHTFTVDGPVEAMTIVVEGEIETQDTAGIVRAAIERLPPALYLRQTETTRPSAAIVELAEAIRASEGGDCLSELHALLASVHEWATAERAPGEVAAATPADRANELAQAFIAAARHLGHPARFVSGYLAPGETDGVGERRGWAEAFVPRLGWVGFDPVEKLCATEAHIRVAVGLDALGAAPVRSGVYGGSVESSRHSVRLREVRKRRPA